MSILFVNGSPNKSGNTAKLAKENGEATVILNGKVSNNEHRIRDIYKALNELKGWPSMEVPQK